MGGGVLELIGTKLVLLGLAGLLVLATIRVAARLLQVLLIAALLVGALALLAR